MRRLLRRAMTTTPLADAAAGTRDDLVQLYNVQLGTDTTLTDGELWMQGGTIVDPQRRFWARAGAAADRRVDCGGRILAPGFIDTQLYAAAGVVFDELGADAPMARRAQRAGRRRRAAAARRHVLPPGVRPARGVPPAAPPPPTAAAAPRRRLPRLPPRRPFGTPPPDGPHCVMPSLASGRAALLETYGDDLARSAALLTLAPSRGRRRRHRRAA